MDNVYAYKVLLLGERDSGKTSIMNRYVHNVFLEFHTPTIGVDIALKFINLADRKTVALQICDISGEERCGVMTRPYYKEAAGAMIVFDSTCSNSFNAVSKWKTELDSKVEMEDGCPIPCMLIANKCDLAGSKVCDEYLEKFCADHGFSCWFHTSAKENDNIEYAFKHLIDKMVDNNLMGRHVKLGRGFQLGGGREEEIGWIDKCYC